MIQQKVRKKKGAVLMPIFSIVSQKSRIVKACIRGTRVVVTKLSYVKV